MWLRTCGNHGLQIIRNVHGENRWLDLEDTYPCLRCRRAFSPRLKTILTILAEGSPTRLFCFVSNCCQSAWTRPVLDVGFCVSRGFFRTVKGTKVRGEHSSPHARSCDQSIGNEWASQQLWQCSQTIGAQEKVWTISKSTCYYNIDIEVKLAIRTIIIWCVINIASSQLRQPFVQLIFIAIILANQRNRKQHIIIPFI